MASSSKRLDTPGVVVAADPDDLEKLKEVTKKVKHFVPNKFEECLSIIDKVMMFLQKFCLSFYDMANDPDYETGQHYSLSMIHWKESMKQKLDSVRRLAMKFAVDSVFPMHLCAAAQKIVTKTESERFAFLSLFTHVSETIREVCDTLKDWIKMEENYPEFLAHDIKDLEKQKTALSRKTRDAQEAHFQAIHRIKNIDAQRSKNDKQDKILKIKADNLIVEEEMLIRYISETKVDIDIRKFQKEELIRNIGSSDGAELREKFDEIREDMRILKDRLPTLEKRMVFVKEKLDWIDNERDCLENKNHELLLEKQSLSKTGDEKSRCENELDKVTRLLEHVKLMALFKMSPDVLVKIHYGIPYEMKTHSTKLASDKHEINLLDRACNVVAEEISKDWPSLYSLLPFLPPRGRLNIEADIQDITRSYPRDSHADQALKSLYRWRRFHIRARLQDLKTTLAQMNRQDVLDVVEYTLNPPVNSTEVKESTLPTFLEPHLIPYYRAVERYDQLRASHG
ncbi:uncharacterized protein LOC141907209 [Tubulanus polymorphus]|uniref:uncharacterized protein LOC141907209 n=1 Tax=Tubulanus polymorphus TaxID=672921 RepID=UPI003DA69CDA